MREAQVEAVTGHVYCVLCKAQVEAITRHGIRAYEAVTKHA